MTTNRLARHSTGFYRCVTLLLMLCLLPVARADILVAPTRITLEPGERVGQVVVMNSGDEPVTLRISFVNYHMRANGTLEKAEKPLPGEHFAENFLVYSPRRIQLAPGEEQTVRVLARPPSGTAREYRSHLQFQAEPPPRRQTEEQANAGKGNLSIEITPLYGISIPVIVRTGALNATAGISDVSVQRGPQGLLAAFRLERTGNRSVYGDFRVIFTPRGGQPRLVAHTRGVAVYPPLQAREVRLPLSGPLSAGRLRIEYVDNQNNERVLASTEREIR